VTATPERGAHTDEVLREAGYDDAAIASLRKKESSREAHGKADHDSQRRGSHGSVLEPREK
jgi:hypothetical protein